MTMPRRDGLSNDEREAIEAIVEQSVLARQRFERDLDRLIQKMAQDPRRQRPPPEDEQKEGRP